MPDSHTDRRVNYRPAPLHARIRVRRIAAADRQRARVAALCSIGSNVRVAEHAGAILRVEQHIGGKLG